MLHLEEISALRSFSKGARARGKLALVPTMGNLHAGHLSLITRARSLADTVIASVFVNPSQFGAGEDFSAYPRTLEADAQALESVACDALFLPSVATMYPGFADAIARGENLAGRYEATQIHVKGISDVLCGQTRPGHFSGVATVVAKLFNLVEPDIAIFGEKDFQQVLVIKTMVQELNFPVQIETAATVREANGLARSSRNQYLSAEERSRAGVIYQTLLQMRHSFEAGDSFSKIEQNAAFALIDAGLKPDYAVLKDAQSLESIGERTKSAVALIAARLGKARLIDNISWNVKAI
jgi:pantoate--beta-alanine ligase